jgi:hypothetical protein
MTRRTGTLLGLGLTAAFAGLVAFTGCETSPASERVMISPDSATIHYNQSIALTAHGGYDYTWSLADDTQGTLSPRTGATVTYTSLSVPAISNTLLQVITVTSTIDTFSGGTTSSSNSVQNEFTSTAQSFITQIP